MRSHKVRTINVKHKIDFTFFDSPYIYTCAMCTQCSNCTICNRAFKHISDVRWTLNSVASTNVQPTVPFEVTHWSLQIQAKNSVSLVRSSSPYVKWGNGKRYSVCSVCPYRACIAYIHCIALNAERRRKLLKFNKNLSTECEWCMNVWMPHHYSMNSSYDSNEDQHSIQTFK